MQTRRFILPLIIFFSIFLISCKGNHFKIDTSGIKVEINIKRLETDLFILNPSGIKEKIPVLTEKYDGFLKYFGYVINIGEITDSVWADGLVKFCTDKLNNEVYASTIQKYPDLREIEDQLTNAFRHYIYYFPYKKIPGVYSCTTGFNNSIITGDSVLGIGLDRYLGSDSKFYPALQIYKYQAAKMNSFNIVPDCMYAWATSEWNLKETGYKEDNVLTEIIHEGKLFYFVKSMLPDIDESLIFGFTQSQMKFCMHNEAQMWQYLVEHNLLFSSEQLTKRKLIGDAPFTSYFSRESPGRAAAWIGFRIIDSFMMNSKGVSFEDMMKNTDVQGILEKARYSPK
jgi:hypothetical protein